jgi:hypothetical protein
MPLEPSWYIMENLSDAHKNIRRGKLHSVIDDGLKSCILINVTACLFSGSNKAGVIDYPPDLHGGQPGAGQLSRINGHGVVTPLASLAIFYQK